MLEEICRYDVHAMCERAAAGSPPVKAKGAPWRETNEFIHFFQNGDNMVVYPKGCIRIMMRQTPGPNLPRQAFRFFSLNAKAIFGLYLKAEYGGDILTAMRKAETFNHLYDAFKHWFSDRRMEFMEKTNNQLVKKKSELAVINKAPQSHGGVANLLKVLTKTMTAQGASIKSIAKVQYTVCMNAGIYIPDEFITDVLTVSNIEGDI